MFIPFISVAWRVVGCSFEMDIAIITVDLAAERVVLLYVSLDLNLTLASFASCALGKGQGKAGTVRAEPGWSMGRRVYDKPLYHYFQIVEDT